MADYNYSHDGQSKVDGLTLNDVMVKIESLCVQNGLSYQHHAPIQVSPGVWMFYAVARDYNCTKFGSCRQRQHFAIDVGGRLTLT